MSSVDIVPREALVALVEAQRATLAQQDAELARLREENAALRAEHATLHEEVQQLREQVQRLSGPPAWVKAKTPPREEKTRKKRATNTSRLATAEPNEVVEHAIGVCPGCGHLLEGGTEHSSYEVIDLPPVATWTVRHTMIRRRCGVCGQAVYPRRAEIADGSVGRSRFGVGLHSLVTTLHVLARLPYAMIQRILYWQYGFQVSVGEIRKMLRRSAQSGTPAYDALREQMRGSSCVHADETSWRENGQHGWLWAFITPTVCYFERHASRGTKVPRDALGDDFQGTVICDGYIAYDPLPVERQRCWAHWLRQAHQITTRFPQEQAACAWAERLHALYRTATDTVRTPGYAARAPRLRVACARKLQQALLKLATPAMTAELKEWRNLATYLVNHAHEAFRFVEDPTLPSDNNAAERAIRQPVTKRKVCGGTRSEAGSADMALLMSLLQTAHLRGLNPLAALTAMLQGQPFLPAA